MTDALIVIVGGTGYLGSQIARQLLTAGYRVRIAARHPERFPVSSSRVALHKTDILDTGSITRALEDADAVVNAVSLYVEKRPGLTFDAVHVDGAERLAQACARAGIPRLVHISGLNPDPASRSHYVSARGRGEQRVRDCFPGVTILRPGALFGHRQGLVATLEGLTLLPLVPLFGHGGTRLQPVHVDDVAQAARAVIGRRDTYGRIYELGGARIFTYRALVDTVMRQQHRRRLLIPIPFRLWHLGAALLSVLPSPPLTRDQLMLMETDNVVNADSEGFGELGIIPQDIAAAG